MLTLSQEQRAHVARLDKPDVHALALLGLVNQFTSDSDMKSLSYALRLDDAVRLPRAAMWIEAQDAAREANADPDWNDSEAWFHIADSDFTTLDVVEKMSTEERAALRARLAK
jgi:hypothetical protein